MAGSDTGVRARDLPKVADNLVSCFRPFRFSPASAAEVNSRLITPFKAVTLGDIEAALGADAFTDNQRKEAVYHPVKSSGRPKDLHGQILKVLHGGPQDPGGAYRGGAPLCLREQARNDVNRIIASLVFKDGSQVPMTLSGCEVYLFGSGIGCAVVKVRVKAGNEAASLEDLARLVERFSLNRPKQDGKVALKGNKTPLPFEHFLKALLPVVSESGCDWVRSPRMYTLVGVLTDAPFLDPVERQHWLYVLSKGIKSDQSPSQEELDRGFMSFRKTRHGVAGLEGAAILVEGGRNQQSFETQYLRSSFEPTYLPICLAAYHEYEALVAMRAEVEGPVVPGGADTSVLEKLEAFQARLLDFRINWRFAHVSRIGLHNRFYQACRDGLSLSGLWDELSKDVDEAARYMEHLAVRKRTALDKSISYRQSAWGVFFGGFVVLAGLAGMNFRETTDQDHFRLWPERGWQAFAEMSFTTTASVVYAVIVVGLWVMLWGFFRLHSLARKELREAGLQSPSHFGRMMWWVRHILSGRVTRTSGTGRSSDRVSGS